MVETVPSGKPPVPVPCDISVSDADAGLCSLRAAPALHGDGCCAAAAPRRPTGQGAAAALQLDVAGAALGLMQSHASSSPAAGWLETRDIYNLLLDRELARARGQYDEGDRIRALLARRGVTIDDQWRRWRSRDGRGGRRPSAEDSRWAAHEWNEPLPRAEQDAASASAAVASSGRVHERIFWNRMLDRETARCRGDYTEADNIRNELRAMGVQIDDQRREWRAADGRTGARINSNDAMALREGCLLLRWPLRSCRRRL